MSVQVVTVFNREPDRAREPYYRLDVFRKSAALHGITPTVLGLNEPWGGLMTKPRRLRQWLRAGHATAETLIVCDAFDIVWTCPAEEVEAKYLDAMPAASGRAVIFNAEKGIFPRGELAHSFENVPGPWKYLNSGFFIGPPAMILAMLQAMWLDDIHDDIEVRDDLHGSTGPWIKGPNDRWIKDPNDLHIGTVRTICPNDQGWYQLMYAAQVVPMFLDNRAELCQCCSACTIEEFDLTGPRIQNVVTATEPLVWHFNGASKNDLMPLFLAKLGLE